MVMGGPVKGGQIYGDYPTISQLQIGKGLDVGSNGRLLPTTSVDVYMAELAHWFAGDNSLDLSAIFPNLNHFADSPAAGFKPSDFLDFVN